jgi:hypothetical protein
MCYGRLGLLVVRAPAFRDLRQVLSLIGLGCMASLGSAREVTAPDLSRIPHLRQPIAIPGFRVGIPGTGIYGLAERRLGDAGRHGRANRGLGP